MEGRGSLTFDLGFVFFFCPKACATYVQHRILHCRRRPTAGPPARRRVDCRRVCGREHLALADQQPAFENAAMQTATRGRQCRGHWAHCSSWLTKCLVVERKRLLLRPRRASSTIVLFFNLFGTHGLRRSLLSVDVRGYVGAMTRRNACLRTSRFRVESSRRCLAGVARCRPAGRV